MPETKIPTGGLPEVSVDLVAAARRSEDGFFKNRREDETIEAAERYRKFLALIQRFPEEIVAPTKDIDEMWHLHMLHPVAYHRDCMANFGEIIDHDGGFGSSPEEIPVLLDHFKRTSVLWEREFGEPYACGDLESAKCTRNCVSRCQRACKTK
ncbi:MAG: glycine-rich domain-containing protein-like [Phycisphaerales bacterium]